MLIENSHQINEFHLNSMKLPIRSQDCRQPSTQSCLAHQSRRWEFVGTSLCSGNWMCLEFRLPSNSQDTGGLIA